ncbi:MAG: hypothetical protein AB1715_10275 [Acidobacteriota bacterium]
MRIKGFSVLLVAGVFAFALGCKQKAIEEARTQGELKAQEGIAEEAQVKLPAAVAQAVKENVPDAEIEKLEVTEESGITLYDIEFKGDRGEIEVALDGTVMDIATIITLEDLPRPAAESILRASEDAVIKRLEKSEVRAEIREEGGKGRIIKLDSPRYVYEAELLRNDQTGEIEVDPDGKIIEPLKWNPKAAA